MTCPQYGWADLTLAAAGVIDGERAHLVGRQRLATHQPADACGCRVNQLLVNKLPAPFELCELGLQPDIGDRLGHAFHS